MRRDRSPFHHVVYFAIYGSLITAHAVEYPRGKQPPFLSLRLAADTHLQHAALWFCPHDEFSDFIFFSVVRKHMK